MNKATFVALALAIAAGAALLAVNLRSDPTIAALDEPTVLEEPTTTTPTTIISDAPELLGMAPGLENLDGWLNTDKSDFTDFDGRVRIVQFWTFGCINCKRTLENLSQIYGKHGDDPNFEIIGVHSPEFSHEADVGNIIEAAAKLGVVWPIALDTDKFNFRSWQEGRRFWPRTYVLDSKGNIRLDHVGEGQYSEIAATVDWLLANEL